MIDLASAKAFFKRPELAMPLAACLLFYSLMLPLSGHAQEAAPTASIPDVAASDKDVSSASPEEQGDESDWRAPLLSEMGRMASDLELQRRLNILLEDKVDYMTHRLDQLEQRNLLQAKRIEILQKALTEAKLGGALQGKNKAGDTAISKQAEKLLTPEHQAPPRKYPEKEAEGKAEENEATEFERFLDMGEAMMRRFFGVVQEFRKEFDDNRV